MKTSFCEISLKASYYDLMSWKRKVKNSVWNLLKQSPGGVLWRNVFPRNVTKTHSFQLIRQPRFNLGFASIGQVF